MKHFILLTGTAEPMLVGPFTSQVMARAFATSHRLVDYQITTAITPDQAAKMAGTIKALVAGTLQV